MEKESVFLLQIGFSYDADRSFLAHQPQELHLAANRLENGLNLIWSYNSSIFSQRSMVALNQQLNVLLKAITANPKQSISALPLLNEKDRQKVLTQWNQTQTAPGYLCPFFI